MARLEFIIMIMIFTIKYTRSIIINMNMIKCLPEKLSENTANFLAFGTGTGTYIDLTIVE